MILPTGKGAMNLRRFLLSPPYYSAKLMILTVICLLGSVAMFTTYFSEDSFSPSDHIDDIDFDDEDHTYGPYRSLSMAKYSPLSSVALRKHHPRLMNRWPHWPSVRVNLTRGNGSEVTCHRLFDSFEFVYAKQVSDQVPTVTLVDDAFLGNDTISTCTEIRRRNTFPSSGPQKPLSFAESVYPVAIATIAYRDYIMLERIFALYYQQQNHFCYVFDSKAPKLFKKRMWKLAECFPDNVHIAEREFSTSSSGHNMSRAYLACLEVLKDYDWKYVIQLQNHDVPLKTNRELVEIFRMLNGTNDIATDRPVNHRPTDPGDYSFTHLLLLAENSSLAKRAKMQEWESFKLTKSFVQASLSRPFVVDFLLGEELKLDGFIDELELDHYGMDEHFLSTLNANDVLQAPGGFTLRCLIEKKVQVNHFTRYTVWSWHDRLDERCRSMAFRHSICIPGVEDLAHMTRLPHLFYNKMSPSLDYTTFNCLMTALEYRSRNGKEDGGYGIPSINRHFYLTLPHVRWNRCGSCRTADFDCSHPGYKNVYAPPYHENQELEGDKWN